MSQPGVEQSILLESGLARSIVSRVIRTLHFASCIVAGKKQCVNIIKENLPDQYLRLWLFSLLVYQSPYYAWLSVFSQLLQLDPNLIGEFVWLATTDKSRTQKYGSVNSKRAHPPSGICRAFVILFWKSYKCPTVGPGVHTKTPRWGLKIGCKWPTRDNTKIAVSSK